MIYKSFIMSNFNIGINHGFQCSNIRWITRKVFEHKAAEAGTDPSCKQYQVRLKELPV